MADGNTTMIFSLGRLYPIFLSLGIFFVLMGALSLLFRKDPLTKVRSVVLAAIYGLSFLFWAVYPEMVLNLKIFHNFSYVHILTVLILDTIISLFLYDRSIKSIFMKKTIGNFLAKEHFRSTVHRYSKFISKLRKASSKNMKIKKNKKNIPLENKNESPRISSAGRNEAVLNTDKVPKNVEGAQHIKDEPAPRKEAVVPVVPEVPEKKPKVAPSTQKNDSGEPASKKEYETKKENDVLKEKIKEQKRILRKKIETARRNAYVTRKPTEIEKTEKIIKDILDKYGLTEETLNEDS